MTLFVHDKATALGEQRMIFVDNLDVKPDLVQSVEHLGEDVAWILPFLDRLHVNFPVFRQVGVGFRFGLDRGATGDERGGQGRNKTSQNACRRAS